MVIGNLLLCGEIVTLQTISTIFKLLSFMSNITAVIATLDQKKLNADQKKYFKLLSDIEKLNHAKEENREFYLALLNKYKQHLEPIIKANAIAYKEMAVRIDEGSKKGNVTKKTIKQCENLIIILIEKFLEVFPKDETTDALYNYWSQTSLSFQDEAKDNLNKVFLRNSIMEEFGIEIDVEDFDFDFDDPASYKKFQEKYAEQIREKSEAEKEKWDNRKKTKREVAQEAKEKVDKRNIREIYIGLAKQLHPDKASNDIERERNESAMKSITEAYESNDLITLLNLEIMYLANTENDVLNLESNKIKSYINVLTQQKRKATQELEMVKGNPAFEDIYKYIMQSSPNVSLKIFDNDFAVHKNNNVFLLENLQTIKSIDNKSAYQKFVAHLYEQFSDEQDDFDFFNMFEFLADGHMDDFFEDDDYHRSKKKSKKKR